ncbi:hypothetical protein B0H67DRAFT_669833 [Lasiosphaeris hirsuta]|uniref:Uncharacterized protein n=1 Tax=Lasiosphaeris hirsuta TaxID=260670 RepID=A0AA40DSU5_9PEZI|nr:hypothetical protein B0H67DRAFT_669833 [Lasiosphaeris hirsuta]
MHTAVMSFEHRDWTDNIAISSTHFRDSNFTVAIIYGCSDELKDGQPSVMDNIESLLARSPEVKGHPLLLPGLFAELQRDRTEDLVVCSAQSELEHLMFELKLTQKSEPSDWDVNHRLGELDWFMFRRLGGIRLKMMDIEEEARVNDWDVFKKNTKRFKVRFEELCNELDAFMVRCRRGFEEATFARELREVEVSRQEAGTASRQTRINTAIAFVAMLYLPITLVATIFAMPVFDFKNHWTDARLRYAPSDGPNPNSSNSSQAQQTPEAPVVSGYFWWYLIASVSLTVLTVSLWSWYTRVLDPLKDANERAAVVKKRGSRNSISRASGGNVHTTPSWNPLARYGIRQDIIISNLV